MTDTTTTTPAGPAEQRSTPAPESNGQQDRETALEALASICTIIVLWAFVTIFIFQNFVIPSGSMENTLLIGDHVLVNRLTLAPPSRWAPFVHYRNVRRGDVIVFLKPHPETPDLYLVKRCVGLPGDRIHLRDGVLYVNGVAQKEPYAQMPRDDGNPDDAYTPYRDDFPADLPGIEQAASENNAALWAVELPSHVVNGDLVVPPGTVFAMGDNRTESLDGRYWGFVPRQNIIGTPLFVYWSFVTPADQINETSLADRLAFMGHILTHFISETRWSRTFHIIR